jgi:hypothetical protein
MLPFTIGLRNSIESLIHVRARSDMWRVKLDGHENGTRKDGAIPDTAAVAWLLAVSRRTYLFVVI